MEQQPQRRREGGLDPCSGRVPWWSGPLVFAVVFLTILACTGGRALAQEPHPRLDLVVEVSTWAPACQVRLSRREQHDLMEAAQPEADRLDRELGREAAAAYVDELFRRAGEERGRSREYYPAERCRELRRRLGEGLQLAARP